MSSQIRILSPWFTLMITMAFTVACQPDGLGLTPRLATATAVAHLTPTPTPTRLVITAPTPTAVFTDTVSAPDTSQPNPLLTLLVNETSADHKQALQTMAADFTQQYGIDIALQFVASDRLPKLIETAIISEAVPLPDIILHPFEHTHGWAEQAVFNTTLTHDIFLQLGPNTFDPAVSEWVKLDDGMAALPSHGAYQLLIYRQDWFDERGLARPDNFDDLFAAAQALTDRENLVSGFVIPTESNLPTTQQAFEHLARANGCQLIDDKGEVLFLEPACQEALDYYFSIVNQFSPIGVQTDISTRNAYLSGRTGIVMAPPTLLPQLAGLDPDAVPTCPQCTGTPNDFLAQNSGIVTTIRGNGTAATPATFANITNLGITRTAPPNSATTFANYWFNDGYEIWLAVHPESKVPMRWGTTAVPRQFIDTWGTTPLTGSTLTLQTLYGPDVVAQLSQGVAQAPRWGLSQGQGALITELYSSNVFPVVLQEMLSGYFGSQETRIETYQRVIELIPNYPFVQEEEIIEEDAS